VTGKILVQFMCKSFILFYFISLQMGEPLKWERLQWVGNSHIFVPGVRLFHQLFGCDPLRIRWRTLCCLKVDSIGYIFVADCTCPAYLHSAWHGELRKKSFKIGKDTLRRFNVIQGHRICHQTNIDKVWNPKMAQESIKAQSHRASVSQWHRSCVVRVTLL